MTPYQAIGIMIAACSPGGTLSNVICYSLDGELALR